MHACMLGFVGPLISIRTCDAHKFPIEDFDSLLRSGRNCVVVPHNVSSVCVQTGSITYHAAGLRFVSIPPPARPWVVTIIGGSAQRQPIHRRTQEQRCAVAAHELGDESRCDRLAAFGWRSQEDTLAAEKYNPFSAVRHTNNTLSVCGSQGPERVWMSLTAVCATTWGTPHAGRSPRLMQSTQGECHVSRIPASTKWAQVAYLQGVASSDRTPGSESCLRLP